MRLRRNTSRFQKSHNAMQFMGTLLRGRCNNRRDLWEHMYRL